MPEIVPETVEIYRKRADKPIILADLINSRVHIENAFIHGQTEFHLETKNFGTYKYKEN